MKEEFSTTNPQVDSINTLLDEITDNLTSNTAGIQAKTSAAVKNTKTQRKNFKLEVTRSKQQLEKLANTYKKYLERKEILNNCLEKDDTELKNTDREISKLLAQAKGLELRQNSLKADILEKEQKIAKLTARQESFNEKKLKQAEKYKNMSEIYRKHLGLDILPVENGYIKISFTNLSSEAYILIDFEREDPIIEVFPEIFLETVNEHFKCQSFYSFIKELRKELKSKI